MLDTMYIRRAAVTGLDPEASVGSLARELQQPNLTGVLLFCSADYDPEALAAAIGRHFTCPVVGCTTAGEIGESYQTGGIAGVSFSADRFVMHPRYIPSLKEFDAVQAQAMAESLRRNLVWSDDLAKDGMFGLTLLDGLSVQEEKVIALVDSALPALRIVGGSAGDSLEFRQTRILHDGRFQTGGGLFILFETRMPFKVFKLQHFVPSETDLVITAADPETRTVYEINGVPAGREYARLLGLRPEDLSPSVFSRYPLMLQVGQEWYVRSISRLNDDGSFTFFCAIDEGLVLTMAYGSGLVETLAACVAEMEAEFDSIACTLGCDCILRRLELEAIDRPETVNDLLRRLGFIGFSTFGEQFRSLHVNQTLTGVILGEKV